MKFLNHFAAVCAVMLFSSACASTPSDSPEQDAQVSVPQKSDQSQADPTIAATAAPTNTNTPEPTATPLPTETPTPVVEEISLTLSVVNESGDPLPNVDISIAQQTYTTDANGQIQALALTDAVEIVAQISGYAASTTEIRLVPGANQTTLTLVASPVETATVGACNTNETLVFFEDFELEITDLLSFSNAYNIIEDSTGNSVISMQQTGYDAIEYFDQDLTNHILRFNIQFTAENADGVVLNWLEQFRPLYYTYVVYLNTEYNYDVTYFYEDDTDYTDESMTRTRAYQDAEQWHLIEIGTLNGETIVYMDGEEIAQFTHTETLSGGFSLSQITLDENTQPEAPIYFDNIRVCALTDTLAALDQTLTSTEDAGTTQPSTADTKPEKETQTDTADAVLPTPVPLPTVAVQPTAAPLVINPKVTVVSTAQVGNCAWEIHFKVSGFLPNSGLFEETTGTATDCAGATGATSTSSGVQYRPQTNVNGETEWKVTVAEHGTFTATFTDDANNAGTVTYQVINERAALPTPTLIPFDQRPTLEPSAPVGAGPTVRVVSVIKVSDCVWEVHYQLSGFTPSTPLSAQRTGAATDCIGNVVDMTSTANFGEFGSTTAEGTDEWISTITSHGVFTMTVSDQAGKTATTTFQVFP